ncbi:MAG: hypothetical protein COB38_04995 [Gammaproteobacteria bacterium]|nr:MAG: hypothetical protein COB38_04995 [Gammaproteobacteria bacterium]
MVKILSKSILLILSIVLLAGCEGLPDSYVDEFERMPGKQDRLARFIEQRNTELKELSNHTDSEFLTPYSQNENWAQHFVKATSQLTKAQSLYDNEISAIYDKDDPKDATSVFKLNRAFAELIQNSTSSARYVNERIAFLIETRENAQAIQTKAKQQLFEIDRIKEELLKLVKKTISVYPNKLNDLNAKLSSIDELVKNSKSSSALLNTQHDKLSDSSTKFIDYAIIGDQAIMIERNLSDVNKQQKETQKKISQLEKSYIKVLADQRIEYFLVIRRASWCEGEYCGNGSEKIYSPIKVDSKVFEYFDSSQIETLATIRRSWGKETFKINVKKDMWKALALNERYRWSRGHTHADYWIQKLYSKTFHKYVEIENDQSKETGWQSVSETYFWKQYDNLGMAIITKPYGFYEEDAISDAQPVGMATIAEPVMKDGVATGANRYGEWRQSNGLSFWHYYGMYHMYRGLIGPSRYGYNDWSGYNSRRRGSSYYGRNNRWGTFGSSTYSNSRYQNSGFARANSGAVYSARTGKGASSSSVRGASSSNRNRGPSSRGK